MRARNFRDTEISRFINGTLCPSLEGGVFYYCTNLTEVVIPRSVTNITSFAFGSCYRLESVTVGAGLLTLWEGAFDNCEELSAVRFAGPAPTIYHPPNFPPDQSPFEGAPDVRVYYLPGTEGWGESFGGRPTVPWLLAEPVILGETVRLTSESFSFRISWATNAVVTIESAEQLLSPACQPIGTNVLQNGYTDFEEKRVTTPARVFRVRAE